MQRACPIILIALGAIVAFIPLTHSLFWAALAYTLIGGIFAGIILTLVFLPAMHSICFKIRPSIAIDALAVSRAQTSFLAPNTA